MGYLNFMSSRREKTPVVLSATYDASTESSIQNLYAKLPSYPGCSTEDRTGLLPSVLVDLAVLAVFV